MKINIIDEFNKIEIISSVNRKDLASINKLKINKLKIGLKSLNKLLTQPIIKNLQKNLLTG